MCLPSNLYKGLYEGITNIDVSEASRSTDDCWCLLDALRWPLCSSRVWPHFMFFWTYLMGSRCCHTPTKEGGVAIWVCSDDSSSFFRFKVMLRSYWRQMDAFLWLPCTGGPDLCCSWTMCTELHGLVLYDFASIHEADTARGSTQTSTCHARWDICGIRYAWVPGGDSSYGGSTYTCIFWCGAA